MRMRAITDCRRRPPGRHCGRVRSGIWAIRRRALARPCTTGQAAIGGPFSLTDQYGHTRSDKDFAGRYMLVYFGYSYCPDVCPTTLSVIADAMDKLQGRCEAASCRSSSPSIRRATRRRF